MDLEPRTTRPASDAEVSGVADEVVDLLRCFDSPKDAGSALTLAHFKFIIMVFPPENRLEAVAAVEAHARAVVDLINAGYQ